MVRWIRVTALTMTELLVRVAGRLAVGLAGADPVAAHVGGLSGSTEGGVVPSWLTIATGGVLVGVSFLFTSFVTNHDAIRRINEREVTLPARPAAGSVLRGLAGLAGITVLALVLVTGFAGPRAPTANFAILAVWSGWWAGYAMSVYLLGNSWPALNPWRTLAELLPRWSDRSYPDRLGAWPAVVGLLGLVLVEVVSPLAADAGLLAALVLGYTVVTLAGATAYGVDDWFGKVDPVARVFRIYGRVAPIRRTGEGEPSGARRGTSDERSESDGRLEFGLPVTGLIDYRLPDRPGETAFVVALLWATTYDGLVTTSDWAAVTRAVVGWGVPPLLVYLVTMVGGFAAFYGAYRYASRKARNTGDTYVTGRFIERWFAPSLVPIAVGYHVAHYLSYFLTLAPLLAAAVANPFAAPADPVVLSLPGWFGVVQLGFVFVGHLFALWVAHSLAFELFPGVLKPIRSQYPFVVAMICYTMVSMWVVAQPFTQPPYT